MNLNIPVYPPHNIPFAKPYTYVISRQKAICEEIGTPVDVTEEVFLMVLMCPANGGGCTQIAHHSLQKLQDSYRACEQHKEHLRYAPMLSLGCTLKNCRGFLLRSG
jgi:hypothetical protein